MESDQLQRFRDAVADNRTGPKLATAVDTLRKKKYEVAARESLKRAPRGFDPDHPRVDLLRMKGIHAGRAFGDPRWLHTAGASARIVAAWRDARRSTAGSTATSARARWPGDRVTLAPPEPEL